MKYGITLLLALLSITIIGSRIVKGVTFNQNVKGILKRAADASTIEIAKQELGTAIDYLETNNLTSGYTSILYKTPDEDIGFWYQNLKASHKELVELKSVSALERTNVLIKLRETLLDSGENLSVTYPEGLSVYPNNKLWTALMILALICGAIAFGLPIKWLEDASKRKKLEEAQSA